MDLGGKAVRSPYRSATRVRARAASDIFPPCCLFVVGLANGVAPPLPNIRGMHAELRRSLLTPVLAAGWFADRRGSCGTRLFWRGPWRHLDRGRSSCS